MNAPLTSRLAARAGIRQVDATLKAEHAATAADRAVSSLWSQVLALLRRARNPLDAYHESRSLFAAVVPQTQTAIATSLNRLAAWGHSTAAENVIRTLPRDYLAVAAARHVRQHMSESRELREDYARDGLPGLIQLGIDAAGKLTAFDRLAPLREPATDPLNAAAQRELFKRLLFPTPSAADIARIVYGGFRGQSWTDRLAAATRLAGPEMLAHMILSGYSAGKTQREIAADLLPVVNGVRSTAKRIARTEGIRIANEVQMNAHRQLGDLVIGFQILATLDQHTRTWHRARSGTIYYKTPGPGQKGYAQMPHPPMEAEDPRERPAGTPYMAHN